MVRTPAKEASAKEKAFVIGMVMNGLTQQKAAIAAGYSPKAAGKTSTELIRRPRVKAFMDQLNKGQQALAVAATGPQVGAVIEQLQKIATADPLGALDSDGSVKPLEEWPPELRQCLAQFEIKELWGKDADGDKVQVGRLVKIKFWDKPKAADLVLKQAGAYAPQQHQHAHAVQSLGDLLSAAQDRRDSEQVVDAEFSEVGGTPRDPG